MKLRFSRTRSPSPCGRGLGRGGGAWSPAPSPHPLPQGEGEDRSLRAILSLFLAVSLTACMVGPDYDRPEAPVPVAYKELQGWTTAQPQDAADRGAWWSVYNDPELDHLERQVDVSNQTIKQFEAEYRNAQALVQEAQASLFPVATLNGAVTHGSGFGGGSSSSSSSSSLLKGGGTSHTQYTVEGSISWDLDVWGRIRRQIESQKAAEQVSAADLANARLSAQATLATDYFDLRAEDC